MLRERLAQVFRDRVAGPEAAERAEKIWRTPGERWFTNDDPIAKVNGAASMYVGGIRALLVQSLHPLPMEAVVQFDHYETDPWTRLQTTANYVAATTYARIDDATEIIEKVRRVHDHITGVTEDGQEFRASDPHLLMWVHVAEIESFLTAYQMYSPHPLSAQEQDIYVAQSAIPARILGVENPPETLAELKEIMASYAGELKPTRGTRSVVDFMTKNPPVPWYMRPGFEAFVQGAIASLPVEYRQMLGLPTTGDGWRRRLGAVATASVRWSLGHAELEV